MATEFSKEDLATIGSSIAKSLREQGIHCVSFDEETRKTVHLVHDARLEAGAEHGDVVMTFKIGKDVNNTMKDWLRKSVTGFMILGIIIVLLLSLKLGLAHDIWKSLTQ